MKVEALANSSIQILSRLVAEGPLTPKQIRERSEIPERTVSFALKQLLAYKLCKKIPNLQDMRKPLYHANKDRLTELHIDYKRIHDQPRTFFKMA